MIRIILKLKKKEGDRKSFSELPNGQKRYFSDLMSHRTEIEKDSETLQNFEVRHNYPTEAICFSEQNSDKNS